MNDAQHSSREENSAKGRRYTLIGVLVSVLLAAIKGAAGVFGNSYALIADAIDSLADVASSLIVWGGLKVAAAPPDEDHPYGHGKAEPLAGMVVALLLFAAAITIAIQSIRDVISPQHTPAAFTLIVLVIAVITKEVLARAVLRVGKAIESTALTNDAWHHRSDAITSTAVFIGLSIAIIGGEGYEAADGWAALVAACVIGFNGYRLMRPALAEVMDAAPSTGIESKVREIAIGVPDVIAVEKCYVRKMGLEFYVDIHIEVDGELSVRRGHEIAHEVRDALRTSIPTVYDALVHVEPATKHATIKG